MKILIAVDGSDYTRRALAFLAAHDGLRVGHELTVFTVALALPHRAAAFVGSDLVQNYYWDDAEQVLGPIREFLTQQGIVASFEYEVGHPGRAIAARAHDGGYELVVMGSHGHGAVGALVLGSVATTVLASCKVPVLLVR
ncbi:MAG: universal stress protein [Betaproteobacteria bacterium]